MEALFVGKVGRRLGRPVSRVRIPALPLVGVHLQGVLSLLGLSFLPCELEIITVPFSGCREDETFGTEPSITHVSEAHRGNPVLLRAKLWVARPLWGAVPSSSWSRPTDAGVGTAFKLSEEHFSFGLF